MKYLYTGPFSGVTLETPDGAKEVLLHPNHEVELPDDNEYVKTLVARKHLSKPINTAEPKAAKPAASGSASKQGA